MGGKRSNISERIQGAAKNVVEHIAENASKAVVKIRQTHLITSTIFNYSSSSLISREGNDFRAERERVGVRYLNEQDSGIR